MRIYKRVIYLEEGCSGSHENVGSVWVFQECVFVVKGETLCLRSFVEKKLFTPGGRGGLLIFLLPSSPTWKKHWDCESIHIFFHSYSPHPDRTIRFTNSHLLSPPPAVFGVFTWGIFTFDSFRLVCPVGPMTLVLLSSTFFS